MRRQHHSARIKNPEEPRMGSPQYGRLILDGEELETEGPIESASLVWSVDRGLLAGQELVSWLDRPKTRVVVIDTERRLEVAGSAGISGLCTPIRFEDDALVYRHWHHEHGERELRLPLM